jgi:hypothetical protein
MSEKYFQKFPTITYNGYESVNLMARANFIEKIYNNPDNFYNLELINSERADNISFQLYDDSYMTWLLYFANGIVDPYYNWNLSQYDFNNFLKEKYGSVETAQKKVAYWNNNWYSNLEHITISQYNAKLDYEKKYYEAVYAGNKVLEYKRKELDWTVNTNQIWEYTVDGDANVTFDEKITVYSDSVPIANGQLLFANSSLIRIHQVFGTTDTTELDNVKISGEINNKKVNVSASLLIAKNISDEEFVYWSPVTYYDVEDIKNTNNQNIRILNPEYASVAALQLKRILNGSL